MQRNIYEYRGDRAQEIYTYILNRVTSDTDPHQRISVQGYEEILRHHKDTHKSENLFLKGKKINLNYTCFYGISPANASRVILWHQLELTLSKDTPDTPFNYLRVEDRHFGDPSHGSVLPLGDDTVVNNLNEYFEDWFYEVGRDVSPEMLHPTIVPNRTFLCNEYYHNFLTTEYQKPMLVALGQGQLISRLNRNSPLRNISDDVFARISELYTGDPRIQKRIAQLAQRKREQNQQDL